MSCKGLLEDGKDTKKVGWSCENKFNHLYKYVYRQFDNSKHPCVIYLFAVLQKQLYLIATCLTGALIDNRNNYESQLIKGWKIELLTITSFIALNYEKCKSSYIQADHVKT